MNPWRVLSLAADPMRGRNPEMRFMSQYRNFAGRWGKTSRSHIKKRLKLVLHSSWKCVEVKRYRGTKLFRAAV
jgi:hypothetical protein